MGIGRMVSRKGMELLTIKIAIFMKASFSTENQKAKECMTSKRANIEVSSKTVFLKEKAKYSGTLATIILGILKKANTKDQESTFG